MCFKVECWQVALILPFLPFTQSDPSLRGNPPQPDPGSYSRDPRSPPDKSDDVMESLAWGLVPEQGPLGVALKPLRSLWPPWVAGCVGLELTCGLWLSQLRPGAPLSMPCRSADLASLTGSKVAQHHPSGSVGSPRVQPDPDTDFRLTRERLLSPRPLPG